MDLMIDNDIELNVNSETDLETDEADGVY